MKKIYFVGAGGIGMAALERYYLSQGYKVAGYDRTPSPLTDALIKEGVAISFDETRPSLKSSTLPQFPTTMFLSHFSATMVSNC